jgi:DHA1 family tetracycline resistance protein-like MFS transporter
VTDRRLRTIFLIVFVDLLGFGLVLPLLPFYAENYGATPALTGLLVASYAAAQLVGAPVLGRLSDRYGRRPMLMVSVSGTFIGFLLLAGADPLGRALAAAISAGSASGFILALLFLSRILDGLTGGNISIAQAYIADVTPPTDRARAFGLIGAAFGLGFILGPAIGGTLSNWGNSIPPLAAAAMSFLALVGIVFWLPESLPETSRTAMDSSQRPPITLRALTQAFRRPRVGPLLLVRLIFGFSFALFQTVFPLYAQYRFGLGARSTGYVLAYVGFLVVLVQGVGIKGLTSRIAENRLLVMATGMMTLALTAWAWVPTLPLLLLILIPLALAGGVLNTVINAALSKAVLPAEIGGTLGLSTSIESLTRVVAPSVGGALLGALGASAPGIVGAALLAGLFPYAWYRLIFRPHSPLTLSVASPSLHAWANPTPPEGGTA